MTTLKRALSAFRHGDAKRSAALLADTLKADPFSWEANYYAGLHAVSQRDFSLGSDLIRNAAAILDKSKQEHAGVWYNLGVSLEAQAKLEDAAYAYSRAIRTKPNAVLALANLASIHYRLGDPTGGAALHDRALSVNWCEPDERWAQSLILLLRGDYERGWPLYESRWDVLSFKLEQGRDRLGENMPPLPKARWRGEKLDGERVLVHTEQGAGDAIFALRWLKGVQEKGGRVVLEIHSQLASWAKEHASALGAELVLARGEPIPEDCRVHIPIMSLPHALGLHTDDVPGAGPTLRMGATRDPSRSPNVRVGLCWHGARGHLNDFDRSAPFRAMRPLFGCSGVEWVALTTDADRLGEMEAALEPWERPERLGPGDYLDTARRIQGLDLVISVDTSVAHLAGISAVPTWVMLPSAPEFRWGLEGDTTPWYPSMKLYRKTRWDDWATVVERVKADLESLVSERRMSD
jgi:tetratricopeptide (TPR) repeat protein